MTLCEELSKSGEPRMMAFYQYADGSDTLMEAAFHFDSKNLLIGAEEFIAAANRTRLDSGGKFRLDLTWVSQGIITVKVNACIDSPGCTIYKTMETLVAVCRGNT